MAKKSSSSPIVATAGPSNTSSAPPAPLPQQASAKAKKKNKGNKVSQEPAPPKKATLKKATQANIPQAPPQQNISKPAASASKGEPHTETQSVIRSQSSAQNKNAEATTLSPSSYKGKARVSEQGDSAPVPLEALKCKTSPTVTTTYYDNETFRLAAATPVPISAIVERQFFESELLLYVLENIRGEHKKRQNYHGELDQDETELRRSFVDKLAYICDFRKGGSTVTALALQKTNQGVVFWLAANETVKVKVIDFLRTVLGHLKKVELGASTKTTETQLLACIVPFNNERINYYWKALSRDLPLCIKRLEALEGSTNGKPTQSKIKVLKNMLGALPHIAKDRVELVKECFEARKRSVFETLSQLTASGRSHSKFFDDVRHLLGRLGEHHKATKTIVSAALRFPGILDEFRIEVRGSPPSKCYFQSSDSITLDGMAGRIFTKQEDIAHYQEALDTLERTSNGDLFRRLQQECYFKTRIHAELLLADLFYWHQFDFLEEDPYIGCSKPACFNCFQYLLAHPGNFVLPACHNKLYLTWRTPDILEDHVPVAVASKIRESTTSKMNLNIRMELRKQIDGRYARKAAQYDSVTGTSSSIQVGLVQFRTDMLADDENESDYVSAQEDLPRRDELSSHHSSNSTSALDDSDDDL
ncbi:hypothetical protein LOCC1_G004017, partial [Lachnellula occidentalis]